ncbi:MAG: helix-turn-helix domain-containing protein [Gammaproteobacteria bacterium]
MNLNPVKKADLQRQALDEPRRLTLAEIAKALGVSRGGLKKYRDGTRLMPAAQRRKLARLLDTHAERLKRLARQLRGS